MPGEGEPMTIDEHTEAPEWFGAAARGISFFLPMARILGRWIDYPLGLLMIGFAAAGAFLAADPTVSWLTVFAVAGIGGAVASGVNAWGYGRMTRAAGLSFP